MALVSFSDVSRFYGRQDVLAGVTLAINPGERVGLVGRNGAGKTTIIRLIMDRENPDSGRVTRAKDLRLGYLPQEMTNRRGLSLLELVMDTAEEFRRVEAELAGVNQELADQSAAGAGELELMELAQRHGHLLHLFESLGGWEKEAEAKKILSGLGFEETDFGRDLSEFSGGWMMRGVLARLLLASPDLLVLDEPTNHLDIDSLVWLEGYLRNSPSALLLVSHDRVFLNNVAQKIIEVRQGLAYTYIGNYDHFLEEKAQRLVSETAAFENQQDRIRQMEKFIEKNRVRATTARRAQSRVKMLEKMDRLAAPENQEDQNFHFRLPPPARGPDQVAELAGVVKRFGRVEIYRDLNLNLRRGDRLALIGPNGRGKSTLLKMIAGLEPVTAGVRRLGQGVNPGYFAQFQMDSLSPGHTVLEELASGAGDLGPGSLRSVLGAFLFSGEEVFKKVSVLSGGEKARLALAKIMLTAPNLLLLDEPTNHLDIPGRQMLEDALADYSGALVLISHDRHFINSLCTSVGVIEHGRLEVFPGNFDDYQSLWLQGGPMESGQKAPTPSSAAEAPTTSGKKEARKQEAQSRRELAARQRPFKERAAAAETRLAEIARRKDELVRRLADPGTYQDGDLARDLNREFQALTAEAQAAEKSWEEAMQALEELAEKS
ncbi:MAG: ABC-F family ATP-binding cassette domain-containing protein [Candidatus Adiutrix sp.]|jgi:ATP-binding cassette subfamily F protein 3|nr:ABC-F family ATP-binding cassette domain-containing protein [Candidatus Adiutrix sp.]